MKIRIAEMSDGKFRVQSYSDVLNKWETVGSYRNIGMTNIGIIHKLYEFQSYDEAKNAFDDMMKPSKETIIKVYDECEIF